MVASCTQARLFPTLARDRRSGAIHLELGKLMNWHTRFVQQATWTRESRTYLFGRAGLERSKRVLEVGCGTGAILSDLPGRALIHGVDLDFNRLTEAHLHAPGVQLVCGNGLCLPW